MLNETNATKDYYMIRLDNKVENPQFYVNEKHDTSYAFSDRCNHLLDLLKS